MGLKVHEVHAAVIHAPLALLPMTAGLDLVAASRRDRGLDRLGSKLWWATAASGLFAGVAGMAASQQVKADDRTADDMMWVHGIVNLTVVTGILGIAAWRTTRRPSVGLAVAGLGLAATSMYTAYLGGEMVYGQGLGVRAMPGYTPVGVRESVPVLSAEAPKRFLRDAIAGLTWLFQRAAKAVSGTQAVSPHAFGVNVPERRTTTIDDLPPGLP